MFCIVSATVPAVDETVFVWASENKCFLTSLASVLTAAADEVVSLLFVSHSVCPENIVVVEKFLVKYFLLFLPEPDILGEPKET